MSGTEETVQYMLFYSIIRRNCSNRLSIHCSVNADALMGVTAIYRIPVFTTAVCLGDGLLIAPILCELFRDGNGRPGLRHRRHCHLKQLIDEAERLAVPLIPAFRPYRIEIALQGHTKVNPRRTTISFKDF